MTRHATTLALCPLLLCLIAVGCGNATVGTTNGGANLDVAEDTGDALPFDPKDLFVPIDVCEQECKVCLCTCEGTILDTEAGGCWEPCSEGEPVCPDCPTWCAEQADAGAADSGTPDAGTPDTGTPDAGTPDAGTPDAGTPDAGTPDAGTPDAGTPDAGTDEKCQYACGNIGSKSEGWISSCTGKLIDKPSGGMWWDQCAKCSAVCKFKGSKSEGWYSSCSGELLLWSGCFKQWCIPYCGALGTKSEGWFDGCTETLLDDPLGVSKLWAQCAKCDPVCDKKGTKSEGWYDSCSGKLLAWAKCS